MTPRDLANAALHRIVLAGLRLRLFCQVRLGLIDLYQPVAIGRAVHREGPRFRSCEDRFRAFAAELPDEPLSVLDIGCNVGYFTFQMAERGGFCLGIDHSRNDLMVARALATLNRVPNVAFAEMEIDPVSARRLPVADVVICLSVFHHWARKLGETKAVELMGSLASSARRFLVFETGQPDESEMSWAPALSFMQPSPDTWIRSRLAEFGFGIVTKVGEFPTSVSGKPRGLYVAVRAPAA